MGYPGATVSSDPLVGRTLAGRYRVIELLAAGGMGTVYVAEHLALRRAVALKMLGPRLSSDGRATARFLREAEVISQLRHPHIVDVHDFDVDQGEPFLVMELLAGETLECLLERCESLPVDETIRIAAGIASGLAAAHRAGVVHRDLKPSNVFLVADDDEPSFVKLLDFGISKQLVGERRKITGEYDLVGTAHFMAPEQAACASVGPQVDQYALGVTVFQMLSGTLPFDSENVLEVLRASLASSAPRLSERCSGYGTVFDDVLARALARESQDRFPDVTSFVAELRATARAAGWVDSERPPAQSGRRPLAVADTGASHVETRSSWPVDPVRAVMATLDEVQSALGAGEPGAAVEPALRAIALAAASDREASAALTLAAPLIEGVLVAALGGAEARVSLARQPAPVDRGMTTELAYVASRVEGCPTVRDVVDTSPLSRLVTLHALVVLSRRGILAPAP
jgi:protein kinase-like protein